MDDSVYVFAVEKDELGQTPSVLKEANYVDYVKTRDVIGLSGIQMKDNLKKQYQR